MSGQVVEYEGRRVMIRRAGSSRKARHVPAPPQGARVERLRMLFRGMLPLLAHYEATGHQEYVDAHGTTWNVHDVLAWYRASQRLPRRQAQAIHYGLVHDLREVDVARLVGLPADSPVMMHATAGLERLMREHDLGWEGWAA